MQKYFLPNLDVQKFIYRKFLLCESSRVMALYKYFKPFLPDPNGELPGLISASEVAAMNKEVRQETAGGPVAMPKNAPHTTSKLNHITPMETNLIIQSVGCCYYYNNFILRYSPHDRTKI